MKSYLRLLGFARPVGGYVLPYFLFSGLSILFGLVNFTLLIPVLDVLFNKQDPAQLQAMAQRPAFEWTGEYVADMFNYYVATETLNNGPLGALRLICIILIISVLLTNVFRYLAQVIVERLRTSSVRNIRAALFGKISRLHLGYFSNERKGDLLARLTVDVQEVESSVANTLASVVREPVAITAYFAVLLSISVKLTLFTLIIIPVAGVFIGSMVKRMKRDARTGQESLGRLLSIFDESLGGIRVINAFNAGDYIRKKFSAENNFYADTILRMSLRRELAPPFSEFMGAFIVAGILLYGGSLVLGADPELKASAFVGYIAIFSQILKPAKTLSNAFSNVQRGIAAGERIFQVLDVHSQVTDATHAKALPQFNDGIRFDNVRFAYGDNEVLHGLSFHLPKGTSLALVGPSGSGKSTIADLIPRFYDVTGGKITLDGIDVRELKTESLRSHMGIVTQEPILFNDTIYNNIAFAKADATEEEVMQAARVANAHDFIMASEKGYQTMIGDRGTKLSGGQRQRLSIARAVLKNPEILILDEATSALDTESEKLVQQALNSLMKNRTTLIIAHRLSTIQHADQILVIQDGEVVEQGTHLDLLQLDKGLYRRLNQMQQV